MININMLLEKNGKLHIAFTDGERQKSLVLDKPSKTLTPKERDEYILRKLKA